MSKKLLLADDSITIQKVIQITFAHEDYELTITDNGDAALAKAQEIKPDLVMADVYMPGKNGYELTMAIRQDPALQNIPVLLLAGSFEPFGQGGQHPLPLYHIVRKKPAGQFQLNPRHLTAMKAGNVATRKGVVEGDVTGKLALKAAFQTLQPLLRAGAVGVAEADLGSLHTRVGTHRWPLRRHGMAVHPQHRSP